MILLDTHIWYWWVSQSVNLQPRFKEIIQEKTAEGFAVSVISCWEIAKKYQLGKLELNRPLTDWIEIALEHHAIKLLPITAEIAIESTRLAAGFRSDPADEIIVATSRTFGIPLLTADAKLLSYPHVVTLS